MKVKHRIVLAGFAGWIFPYILYWLGGGNFERGESLAATFAIGLLFAVLGCLGWVLIEAEMEERRR